MPRKASGLTLCLEVRITPPDQQPITVWYEKDLQEGSKLLVCAEGEPNGSPKLHYHIYLETPISKSSVRTWILKVLDPHIEKDVKYNGNSLYFTRKPHEHTIPYIIKSRNVLVRVGFAQSTLDEYYEQSENYVKSKNATRKRNQRSRIDEMTEVFTEVKKDLESRDMTASPDNIVSRALAICHSKGYDFPTRMTMEKYILKLMYTHDEYLVRSFYTKSFEHIR